MELIHQIENDRHALVIDAEIAQIPDQARPREIDIVKIAGDWVVGWVAGRVAGAE